MKHGERYGEPGMARYMYAIVYPRVMPSGTPFVLWDTLAFSKARCLALFEEQEGCTKSWANWRAAQRQDGLGVRRFVVSLDAGRPRQRPIIHPTELKQTNLFKKRR